MTQTSEEIKKQIAIFEDQLKILDRQKELVSEQIDKCKEELVKQDSERFWKPEVRELYIILDILGNIHETTNTGGTTDANLISHANCYKASEKELAIKDAAKIRARQIIQRTADHLHGKRYEFVKNKYNNHVRYINGNLSCAESSVNNTGNIYFESIEIAQKCLDLCKKEYEIFLDINGG